MDTLTIESSMVNAPHIFRFLMMLLGEYFIISLGEYFMILSGGYCCQPWKPLMCVPHYVCLCVCHIVCVCVFATLCGHIVCVPHCVATGQEFLFTFNALQLSAISHLSY